MGLCSCTPTCVCAIHARAVEDGGTGLVHITGDGNSAAGGWEVDVDETVWAGANDDGTIDITPGGSYGHDPHLNLRLLSSPTIGLNATANGLRADLISAPAGTGGLPPGVPMSYLGDMAPTGFVMASGPFYAGYVPIDEHPGLFGVIGHMASGGVDPGNGTFLVPYLGDKFLVGQGSWGGIGTPGGLAAVPLSVAQLAQHSHGVSDPTHGHPASSSTSIANDGVHYHEAGTARDSQFVTVNNPLVGGDFRPVDIGGAGVRSTWISIPTFAGPTDPQQGNRGATSNDGLHSHGASTSTSITGAATGISILNEGLGQAHENRPPFYVTNVIISG